MRILSLSISTQRAGCHEWRTEAPARYLRGLGHTVDTDAVGDVAQYDAIIINRSFMDNLPVFIRRCRALGIKLIYDTDDYILGVEPNNWFHAKNNELVDIGVRMLLKEADLITVSTEELKRLYERHTDKPIAVLPNLMDLSGWTAKPKNAKRLAVGWGGSLSHASDLLIPLEAIRDVQKDVDFELVLIGINKELLGTVEDQDMNLPWAREWRHLKDIIEDIPSVRFIAGTDSYQEYKIRLLNERWDIGIAPLLDSTFNRAKSAIKYYEYVAAGIPCLASRVLPYTETRARLVKNRYHSWRSALNHYLLHEEDRTALLKEQRADVEDIATFDKQGRAWEDALLQIAGGVA